MPKYYCDYCNIYLTHDAPKARRDHNIGWKHALNVKNYYMERIHLLNEGLETISKAYMDRGEQLPLAPGSTIPLQTITPNMIAIPPPPPIVLNGNIPIIPKYK